LKHIAGRRCFFMSYFWFNCYTGTPRSFHPGPFYLLSEAYRHAVWPGENPTNHLFVFEGTICWNTQGAHTHTRAHTHTHTHTGTHTHTQTHTHADTHTHTLSLTHTHTHTHTA